ncbi:hypothetical protein [Sphingobium lactosutens]|uniref:hypothetical protein n=1 Tax=Sphingobium lactosutens TaxID=522773 RepID=UPI0015BB3A95|nr:hypothetical protein [Sphingobium lactosutens]
MAFMVATAIGIGRNPALAGTKVSQAADDPVSNMQTDAKSSQAEVADWYPMMECEP